MKKGGEFEAYVAKALAGTGAHTVKRTDPPVRIVGMDKRRKGVFNVVFEAPGLLDFCGSHMGKHIEFDAKDIKGQRLPFSKVRDSQWLRMGDLVGDGAGAGVLVRFRGARADDDKIIGIHAHLLLSMAADGAKSITATQCAEHFGDRAILLPYFKKGAFDKWLGMLAGKKY